MSTGTNTTDLYTLRLVDQILAPLKAIEKHAAQTHQTMERLEKLTSGGMGFMKMAAGITAATGALSLLGKGFGAALGMAERAASGIGAFGKAVIGAVSFREKYLTMLQMGLGDAKGKAYYGHIMKVANLTPGTAAESMENASRFVNIGMRGNTLNAAVAGSMDVQAMYGAESAAKFSRGITDMFSKPKFELQDFKQAVAGIVPAEVAAQQILRFKGITVGLGKAMDKLEELHKHGKVTGMEGALGTMEGLNQHIDKGKGLGSFAEKRGAGSLEGLMSNVMEAPENLLRMIDGLENAPGIQSLKGFLGNILSFFDETKPEAAELKSIVLDMTDALFGGLKNITKEDMGGFFRSGKLAAGELVGTLKSVWGVFGDIKSILSIVGSVVGIVWDSGKALLGGFADGIGPGFKVFLQGADDLFKTLSGGTGVMTVVKAVFHGVGDIVGTVAGAFLGVAGAVMHFVSKLGVLFDWLGKVYDKMAAFLSIAGKGASDSLGSILPGLDAAWKGATGSGKYIAAGAAASAAGVVPGLDAALAGANIPKFGTGALVNSPTLAWIGEDGPEAVVPLGSRRGLSLSDVMGPSGAGADGGDLRATLGGGGGGVSIEGNTFVIHVNTSGTGTSDEQASEFGQKFKDALIEALREAAQRQGVPLS